MYGPGEATARKDVQAPVVISTIRALLLCPAISDETCPRHLYAKHDHERLREEEIPMSVAGVVAGREPRSEWQIVATQLFHS